MDLKLKTVVGIVIILQFAVSAGEQGKTSAAAGMKQPAAATADSASVKLKVQTLCPVMGGAVDHSVSVIWKGDKTHGPKKVYFCCPGCIESFNEDPVKYIKVLEKSGQPIEEVVLKQEKKK
jgi:hypothetical protein